jgi:tetratricopeptide (TPR) repeat protein
MKRILTAIFVISVAGLVFLLPTAGFAQSKAKQATATEAQGALGEEEAGYTEEEYEAYEKATKEPDLDKRLELLDGYVAKYPQSKLMSYITTAYENLMGEYANGEKWDKLLPLAEKWLKTHPDNELTMKYAAAAAQKLGNSQKFLDYALKLYDKTPDASLAYEISQAYDNLKDQAKYLEWTEKLFSYPEFNGEFQLRMLFVDKYLKSKQSAKAADYANKALASLAEAKRPDNVSAADWNKRLRSVRRACYFTKGVNDYEKQNYQAAIKEFHEALTAEKFADAYFYTGYCYWKLDQIDEAIDSFAKANVLGGDLAAQAKIQLETLYKGLHNNTTIGIDKVYNRAKQELGKE